MTICFELSKNYTGFWKTKNEEATAIHCGWLQIFILRRGALFDILGRVSGAMKELEAKGKYF